MIIQWNDDLKIRECTEVSRRTVIASEARNLVSYQDDLGAHRFDFRMRCFCKPEGLRSANAFILFLQSPGNFVEYSDPDWQSSVGSKTTNGARSAGDTQIALTSITNVTVGMFLNFANHSKLYSIVHISGNTLTLNCPLQSSVPASTSVNLNTPKALIELPQDLKRSLSLSKKLRLELTDINLRFQEVI